MELWRELRARPAEFARSELAGLTTDAGVGGPLLLLLLLLCCVVVCATLMRPVVDTGFMVVVVFVAAIDVEIIIRCGSLAIVGEKAAGGALVEGSLLMTADAAAGAVVGGCRWLWCAGSVGLELAPDTAAC